MSSRAAISSGVDRMMSEGPAYLEDFPLTSIPICASWKIMKSIHSTRQPSACLSPLFFSARPTLHLARASQTCRKAQAQGISSVPRGPFRSRTFLSRSQAGRRPLASRAGRVLVYPHEGLVQVSEVYFLATRHKASPFLDSETGHECPQVLCLPGEFTRTHGATSTVYSAVSLFHGPRFSWRMGLGFNPLSQEREATHSRA